MFLATTEDPLFRLARSLTSRESLGLSSSTVRTRSKQLYLQLHCSSGSSSHLQLPFLNIFLKLLHTRPAKCYCLCHSTHGHAMYCESWFPRKWRMRGTPEKKEEDLKLRRPHMPLRFSVFLCQWLEWGWVRVFSHLLPRFLCYSGQQTSFRIMTLNSCCTEGSGNSLRIIAFDFLLSLFFSSLVNFLVHLLIYGDSLSKFNKAFHQNSTY